MLNKTKSSYVIKFLDKGIIVAIFIYALGSITSKALINTGIGLAILFWVIKIFLIKDYKFKKTNLDWPILFFVLSLIFSRLDSWSFNILTNKYFLAIIFYYVIINVVDDLELLKKLLFTAFLSAIIASVYGCYQYYFLHDSRVGGFMLSLAFGGLLSMFMMYSISYILWGNIDKYKKLGLLVLTVVFGMNLLFTKSRGAWLGFISGFLSLSWLKDKKVIILGILVFIILALLLPKSYISRFKSITNLHNNRSNYTRLVLWKSALLMLKDHPVNGVGLGNYKKEYLKHYRQPDIDVFDHVHNNFLQFAAETGLLGLLSFIWLMFSILRFFLKGYYQYSDYKWELFLLSAIGVFMIFNVQGLTEFNFGDTEPLNFFWFIVALNTVLIKK